MSVEITTIADFQRAVWDYYHDHGRGDLPWRQAEADGRFDPYKIMVSEIMLQQTQVSRVIPKYDEFLTLFPDVAVLAGAPLGEVLKAWSGLGYNRRAKFLWQAAGNISREFHGQFPDQIDNLVSLPGVGVNTAGAIVAYAFNQPVAFIETNIRTVFIHHFFDDQVGVSDKTILELVTQTLDQEHPREWYWALMDYGSFLKQTVGNLNRQSKHYAKQSKFKGSKRQIRGQVLRQLSEKPQSRQQLAKAIQDQRLGDVIDDLLHESMISRRGNTLYL